MKSGIRFSAPKVNTHIASVEYNVFKNLGVVMCTIRPARFTEKDCYVKICNAAEAVGIMEFPSFYEDIEILTQKPKVIVCVDVYEYEGYARYKGTGPFDIEYAKEIAYKKAFRSFLRYYLTNYEKVYERLTSWLDSITCNAKSEFSAQGQLDQLYDMLCNIESDIEEYVK